MVKNNNRQILILEYIHSHPEIGNQEIKKYIEQKLNEEFGRVTIFRDLDHLLKQRLIIRQGKGRSVKYSPVIKNPLLKFIDLENYFTKDQDQRNLQYPRFNFEIFSHLNDLFTKKELEAIDKLNNGYLRRIKSLSPTVIKKEFERLTIDLSWKSSQIEGNTYSLLDTEILIKENKEAPGHNKEEAIMILNHKQALDYVIQNKNKFKKLSLRDIEDLFSLLVDGLSVNKGFRKNLVGITGTNYKPLDNQHQIYEAMEKLLSAVNRLKHPLEKALAATLMISYIQPFEDGNKRTSRLIANATLLANNYCPLSFRSISEKEYKKAIIIFYEQNNLVYFKKLFLEQFDFAINNYFR